MWLPSPRRLSILGRVPNPSDRHSTALHVADRDSAVLNPHTAMVARRLLLVVTRRSGV